MVPQFWKKKKKRMELQYASMGLLEAPRSANEQWRILQPRISDLKRCALFSFSFLCFFHLPSLKQDFRSSCVYSDVCVVPFPPRVDMCNTIVEHTIAMRLLYTNLGRRVFRCNGGIWRHFGHSVPQYRVKSGKHWPQNPTMEGD